MGNNELTNNKEKEKKSVLKIIGNIVVYILFFIIFVFACLSITTRVTNGKIGNSQFLVVISSSMDGESQDDYSIKTIPVKSLIKIDLVEQGKENQFYSSLKKGDVLTFNYLPLNNATITHRIIEEPTLLEDGTYKYVLKGDAVNGEGNTQTLYSDGRSGEIIGKVTYTSLFLGKIYFFSSSKLGTILLVVLPSTAICLFEIGKIIYIVSENKRIKQEAAQKELADQKDKEIEDLKKLLEEKNKKE